MHEYFDYYYYYYYCRCRFYTDLLPLQSCVSLHPYESDIYTPEMSLRTYNVHITLQFIVPIIKNNDIHNLSSVGDGEDKH